MGAFERGDWSKDRDGISNKYPTLVIRDLFDNNSVKLDPKFASLAKSVSIDDFDKNALTKIRNNVRGSTVDDFNAAYKGKINALWTKLDKLPYSHSKATENVIGSELGVLVYIDAITSNQDPNDLTSYIPTNRLFCDSKLLDDVNALQSRDSSWRQSCIKTAKAIIAKLPQVKHYEMHYRDKVYNGIRKLGAQLGGLGNHFDRWNPGDVVFVKKGAYPIKSQYTGNIVDYNNYIGKCEDIIMVSLKKEDDGALHGAVSLKTMLSNLPQLSVAVDKYNSVQATFPVIHKQLKKLQNSNISSLLYCTGVNSEIHKLINAEDDKNPAKVKNGTFINSIPNVLAFLVAASGDKEVFKDICNMCYLWAASRTPQSCNYYKASANGCKLIDMNTSIEFKLDKVIIPLDGSARVTFNLLVDKQPWSMIARAKQEQGMPQFMLNTGNRSLSGARPIKLVKF